MESEGGTSSSLSDEDCDSDFELSEEDSDDESSL